MTGYRFQPTTCPQCGADLTRSETIELETDIANHPVTAKTHLHPDGLLADVDNVIANGYCDRFVCDNCGHNLTPAGEVIESSVLPCLIQTESEDYEFTETCPSCWIGVRDLSLHIVVADDELTVNVYRRGREMENALSGFYGPLEPLEGGSPAG